MLLSPGTRLGPYEVLAPIGAGGMGEVYRARDTALDRDVALKILPQAFFADAERVARFRREAKVLASLNHPHIAAIYGLHEEGDGVRALVMELVEGEDLSDRLRRGPIPLDDALPIANQIAQALEAAHAQGIIHRDLKPANIRLRPDGTIKVLDFGLAKAVASDAEGPPDLADSPTVTAVATRAGTILGTASYMSPEQAKGRPVDRRADIWAFGAVLYELLTGTQAFRGSSVAEILAHVLKEPPEWDRLPAGTPSAIRTLLRRCLEKNVTRRLDSALALRLEIDDARTSDAAISTQAPSARRGRVTWKTITAVVGASVATALVTWALLRKESPASPLPARFALTFPAGAPLDMDGPARDFALSPDGRYLVYQSGGRLMLRSLDQLNAVLLSNVLTGRTPFFSPDSKWIGYFDRGDLKKVAVTGEPVVPICRGLGEIQGASWGDDGTIVIASVTDDRTVGLRRVSADGGEATPLTRTEATHHLHFGPSMLPGGRGVLFNIVGRTPGDRELAVLDFKSGQQKVVLKPGGSAVYLESGHLLYSTYSQGLDQRVFGTLWIVGFDLDRLELRGDPVKVSESLRVDVFDGANYAVSKTGTFAYVPPRGQARSFVWVDRSGRETAVDELPPDNYFTMGLSPDETRLLYALENREFDIWIWDFGRKSSTRLTRSSNPEALARWSHDGRQVIFRSSFDGPFNLYSVASDGTGPVKRLAPSSNDQWPNSVTPDGADLLIAEARPKTGFDILRLPLAGGPATVLVEGRAMDYAANMSPDGRYFAYVSLESGPPEAYVRSYSNPTKSWKISNGGGMAPVWSRTGKELFYLDLTNTLMAVPVQASGSELNPGKPAKVFPTNAKYFGNFYSYDVAKDGRFLMMKDSNAAASNEASIVLVLNWFEELRRREPR